MAQAFDYSNCNLRQGKFINFEGGFITMHYVLDTILIYIYIYIYIYINKTSQLLIEKNATNKKYTYYRFKEPTHIILWLCELI